MGVGTGKTKPRAIRQSSVQSTALLERMEKHEDQLPHSDRPSDFYKYRHIDDRPGEDGSYPFLKRSSSIFTHNELYFPSASKVNDPFDCTFQFDWNCSPAEIRRYVERRQNKYKDSPWAQEFFSGLTKGITFLDDPAFTKKYEDVFRQQIVRSWGLYCLSLVPDNNVMWTHYADEHRGFCLRFSNVPNQLFGVELKPEDRGKIPKILRPIKVQYSAEFPVVNCFIDEGKILAEKTCLTKKEQWAHEQEWRIVDLNGPGPHQFPPQCLTGVIFGCRMSEEHEKMIRNWCEDRQPAIKYYQARQSEDSYRLHFDEIP